MKRKLLGIICFLLVICSAIANVSIVALAETTVITLETSKYEVNNGEEIVVNVYLNSDASIGAYHAEVKYDTYRLEYTGGGDSTTDRKVILEGTGYGQDIVYKLTFKTVSGGMAKISCVNADIRVGGNAEGKKQNISEAGELMINIAGEDMAISKENKETFVDDLFTNFEDIEDNVFYDDLADNDQIAYDIYDELIKNNSEEKQKHLSRSYYFFDSGVS